MSDTLGRRIQLLSGLALQLALLEAGPQWNCPSLIVCLTTWAGTVSMPGISAYRQGAEHWAVLSSAAALRLYYCQLCAGLALHWWQHGSCNQ